MVETSASDILKHDSAIREHDVLLGRGGATNNHKGNQHFRTIVAEHQREYLKSRKKEKIGIARRVVAIIQSNGGRFLKRTPADEWVEVDDKRAQEKTSQALREGLDVRNKVVRTGNKSAIRRAQKKFGNIIPAAVVKGNVIVTSQTQAAIKNSLCHEHRLDAHIIVPDGKPEEVDATTQPVFVLYQPQTPLVTGKMHVPQSST